MDSAGLVNEIGKGGDQERRELSAVLASRAFQRGPNIAKILAYVCEKYLAGDVGSIREYNIAVDALGRRPDFDPSTDSIVRVEVSRLRKRLREYYGTEGAGHAVQIRLAESGYVPQFVSKEPEPPPQEPEPPPTAAQPLEMAPPPSGATWRDRCLYGAIGFLAACALAVAWSMVQPGSARNAEGSRSPYLSHLWSQLVGNGRHTFLVATDANAMFLGNLVGRPITLQEYRAQSYPTDLLATYSSNPEARKLMTRLMSTYLTNSQDAIVAAQFVATGARYGMHADVVFARDFRPTPEAPDNIVLLGHRKANPDVELFDKRLNFQFDWDPVASKGLIINRKPQPGEQATYPAGTERTFGTITYFPKGGGSSTVLLVGGSDMSGVRLGGQFLCDEGSVRQLHSILKTGTSDRIPPFELLLDGPRVYNVAYEPRIVAWRIIPE